jgi:hypothetical protein
MFNMASNSELIEEVRNYIVDIEQHLARGNQDDVSYDYILFRLDWVIGMNKTQREMCLRELLLFFER